MDRRYLIATLALVATFAVCSHEMRGGRLVVLASQRLGGISGRCGGVTSAPARIMSEMRARVRPAHPEEAQMLAEMNLPMLRVEAQAAAAEARVAAAGARVAAAQAREEAMCARETARHEAEVARRDAQRAREDAHQDARRVRSDVTVRLSDTTAVPIVLNLKQLPQINEHIQIKTDGLQRRVEVRALQLTADQLGQIDSAVAIAAANLDRVDFAPVIATATANAWKCKESRTWSQQMQLRYGNAMRRTLQSIHNSLNLTNVHQGSGSSL